MTHDELLARIEATIDLEYFKESWLALLALRAVVELHKPQEITLPNGEWGTNCILCDGFDYPCATIQAIEKELS